LVVVVAALILLPKAWAAVRAAQVDRLQRSLLALVAWPARPWLLAKQWAPAIADSAPLRPGASAGAEREHQPIFKSSPKPLRL